MTKQSYPPSFAKGIFGGLFIASILMLLILWHSFSQSVTERNERSALYAKMIEGTSTRTFEAIEISLQSIVQDIDSHSISPSDIEHIRSRLIQTLRFAPHLRQLVLVHGNRTLADTHSVIPEDINLSILGLTPRDDQYLFSGLLIGNTLRGRYLPAKGYFPDEGSKRQIIPLAIEKYSDDSPPFKLIAAFNPGYLKRYIDELNLERRDSVYLIDFDGNSLLQKGLYGPNQSRIISYMDAAINEGQSQLLNHSSNGLLPANTTVVRLLSKYPLAVSVVTDHSSSFSLWLSQKKNLLLILVITIFTMFFGAFYIVRTNREAIEMKEEVQLLSAVVEHSPTVIVITDPDGVIQYVNKTFKKLTGYSEAEVVGHNPRILKSGEKSETEYQQMWQTITSGHTWQGEFHNKRKDGSLYWERATIGPMRNDSGEITHFIALKQHISEEKEAQESLRLASTVFSAAVEAIMVTDSDNRIQMVNDSFTNITGYSPDEVIGKNPSVLKSGEHESTFYSEMFNTLARKGLWKGEIWNKRKSGEIFPQWMTIACRYDTNDKLEGYVAVFSDITQRKQNEATILHQANYDSLTGLPNRNLFEDRLKQAITLAERNKTNTALFYLDLDRFKYVNDTFGHQAGDNLLQQVAKRLEGVVRSSDTVARLGGDEFAIIISDVSKMVFLDNLSGKILANLEAPFGIEGHEVYISGSIGIALYPDNGMTTDALKLNADCAMYKAKEKGRNTYEYFNESLNQDNKRRRQLELDLQHAIDHREFFLMYQPIWSADGQRIESVEALIRWLHPVKGLIPPSDFIPAAEELSIFGNIGEWIIDEAVRFANSLESLGAVSPKVSINISGVQFTRGNVEQMITNKLMQYSVSTSGIICELTESTLLLGQQSIYEQLKGLSDKGVEIALDDFGTGYSSLTYLKKYPVHRLKIDKMFIDDIVNSPGDQALVSGILSMADALNLKTVVEGVETTTQLEQIKHLGSPMIQGYLYAKPMSGEELISLIEKQQADLPDSAQQ